MIKMQEFAIRRSGETDRPASEGYPVVVTEYAGHKERDRAGLCADCQHMRRIQSSRGSTFYLCQLSTRNPDFHKYPRLPVLFCPGYEQVAEPAADSDFLR
jgi:hypothetical protein